MPILLLIAVLAASGVLAEEAASAATEAWREILRYGIDSEVLDVIKKLKEIEDRSLDPELLELVSVSANPSILKEVLDLFAQRKKADAEAKILEILNQGSLEDPRMLVPMIEYLSAIEARSAESNLLAFVDAEDERLAASAIQALGVVGGRAAGERLLAKLQDLSYPESLKPQVILSLGKLRYSEAVDELIAVIANRDESAIWRMYAATALGEIGDPRAVTALRSLFSEQDSLLKAYAASALSRFDMKEVESVLQSGLRDSNAKVRLAAAKALANKAAQSSVEILIYKAKSDPERQVRVQAIQSLGAIGTAKAFAFLREMYRNNQYGNLYRETALSALCDHDLESSLAEIRAVIEAEWASKDAHVLEFSARRLSGMASPGLESILARFLEHPNLLIRIYGLQGIRKNELHGLQDRVRSLSIQDPHPMVRREATMTLEALGD